MTPATLLANAARRLSTMFPGYFEAAKHSHYTDFGWPVSVEFKMLHDMYRRNGLAKAGVNLTKGKTWEDYPALWENEEPQETKAEKDIADRFEHLRLWQRVADADRRALVGGYSGLILRFADNKAFREPVGRVPGGLMGLVEVIPAWRSQLEVSEWDTDERSDTYGQPKMFQFNESALGGANQTNLRSFEVHPDRVVIWSEDGTVHAESALLAGYNDLMTCEKVSGAGGEGFWKNAKSGLSLEMDKEARLEDMAKAMGVPLDEVVDAMDEQIADFNQGLDKVLMLQGMTAKTMGVTLPSPEHFFNIALQSFAASLSIPVKILIGSQTGERASTEDAREWAKVNNARRVDICRPNLRTLIDRLVRFGIIQDKSWVIGWTDLTEATMGEKIDRADKMASINQKSGEIEPVYTNEEIREVTGHKPLSETDFGNDDEGEEE